MTSTQQRREFLKKSLLVAGSAAFAPALLRARVDASSAAAKKEYVEMLETDVVVAGAGAAGIPAAIAAARTGAKVILLEQDAAIGGAPVNMFVTFLCGGPRVGIFAELAEALNATEQLNGKRIENYRAGYGAREQWFLPSSFLRVLTRMVKAEKNIRVVTGAKVVGAIVDEKGARPRVRGVEISRGGTARSAVMGKVVIDATGTGELSELAGCRCLFGRESKDDFGEPLGLERADSRVMPCTLMVILQRIRKGKPFDPAGFKYNGKMEANLGWLQNCREACMANDTGVYLQWGASVNVDTRDPVELGRAYHRALEMLEPDLQRGMEMGFGVHLAPKIGVREVRRVVGDHVMTLMDLRSGKMPDDVVSVGHYPLDIWGRNDQLSEQDKRLPVYGIPYRALIAKDVDGLLLAGKHLSATSIAMGACRVQPIVAAAGEGAGTAAAMAALAQTDPRAIDVKALQKTLLERGSLPSEYKPA